MKNTTFKMALITALMGLSLSAAAASKNIDVTAQVDDEVDLVQSDGSPLPTSVQMSYSPGVGLTPYSMQVKFLSNNTTKDIAMYLSSAPKLVNLANPAQSTNLTVKYHGTALATNYAAAAASPLRAVDLFPAGMPVGGGSVVQAMEISQTTRAPLSTGSYKGTVSLVVVQL